MGVISVFIRLLMSLLSLSQVSHVLAALQAGNRGTQACITAASAVSGIIADLDTTIMFATAGTLNRENAETFADHRYSLRQNYSAQTAQWTSEWPIVSPLAHTKHLALLFIKLQEHNCLQISPDYREVLLMKPLKNHNHSVPNDSSPCMWHLCCQLQQIWSHFRNHRMKLL